MTKPKTTKKTKPKIDDSHLFTSAQSRAESDFVVSRASPATVSTVDASVLTIKVSPGEANLLGAIHGVLMTDGGLPYGHNYVNSCNTIRFGIRYIHQLIAGPEKNRIIEEYRRMCEASRLVRASERSNREIEKARKVLARADQLQDT
jgi:hypothetical protein